jgi:hypothetical protein
LVRIAGSRLTIKYKVQLCIDVNYNTVGTLVNAYYSKTEEFNARCSDKTINFVLASSGISPLAFSIPELLVPLE